MKVTAEKYATMMEVEALKELVGRFASALTTKLVAQVHRGKRGWDDPGWTREDLLRQLRNHVDKGQPLDVAAFAAFWWNQLEGDVDVTPVQAAEAIE
jgi:hypothetical protein